MKDKHTQGGVKIFVSPEFIANSEGVESPADLDLHVQTWQDGKPVVLPPTKLGPEGFVHLETNFDATFKLTGPRGGDHL